MQDFLTNSSKLLLIFLALSESFQLNAQDTLNPIVDQQVESLSEQLESEENDLSNIFDDLDYYSRHPLDINRATRNEIASLRILSAFQIENLILHMKEHGPLNSVYELQSIEGFDVSVIKRISPYLTIRKPLSDKLNSNVLFRDGEHRLLLRSQRILEEQTGYLDPTGNYQGSPYRTYLRYRYRYNNKVSYGLTMESDAGEMIGITQNNNGFDFYSGHIQIKGDGVLDNIIVGDYNLNFGQGLVAWQGFSINKSIDVVNGRKVAFGASPHIGTEENRFFRGSVATVKLNNLQLTGFYSNNWVDANLSFSDSIEQTEFVSSLQSSGLHRTNAELQDRKSLHMINHGVNVSYNLLRFQFGATYMGTQLNKTLNPKINNYNQFSFRGDQLYNTSIDYSYSKHNYMIFGEVANSNSNDSSSTNGFATLNGITIALNKLLSATIVHRDYQRDYFSFFSNGFGEKSTTQNEKGVYIGLEYELKKQWKLNLYYDRYKIPWLSYSWNYPINGNDLFTQLTYQPSKKSIFYMRYKFENRGNKLNDIQPENKRNIRLEGKTQVNDWLTSKTRFETTRVVQGNGFTDQGALLFQDLIFTLKRFKVSVRYAVFNTSSYSSRIYAYENDVPGTWSSPAYYYKGTKFYTMLNYRVGKNINCWLRYSTIHYSNIDIISEGSDNQINGSIKSELKAQLEIRF